MRSLLWCSRTQNLWHANTPIFSCEHAHTHTNSAPKPRVGNENWLAGRAVLICISVCMPSAVFTSIKKVSRCLGLSPVPSSPLPPFCFTHTSYVYPPFCFLSSSPLVPFLSLLSPHVGRILAQGLNFSPTSFSPPFPLQCVISQGQAYR